MVGRFYAIDVIEWFLPFIYVGVFVMQLVLVSMSSFDELCDENYVQLDLAGG